MKRQALISRDYRGSSSYIIQKILHNKLKHNRYRLRAFFIDRSTFSLLKESLKQDGFIIEDEHSWEYDLRIGQNVYEMTLFWTRQLSLDEFQMITDLHLNDNLLLGRLIIPAFSFLEPKYMAYMDKPFCNRHVYTQVNLVLDYHRQQKRQTGIDVFNIVDLIAFKMAIDDNRVEYENCEFHKLFDRSITEALESKMHTFQFDDNVFDLNEYLNERGIFVILDEMFEYLVYHFQDTIKDIIFENPGSYLNVKFSNIQNTACFLETIDIDPSYVLHVDESDSTVGSSRVLYDIITKSKRPLDIEFKLDGEWCYDGQVRTNPELQLDELPSCHVLIKTRNTSNFIENFINWLKLSFGDRCYKIAVTLENYETIRPFIFYGLAISTLQLVRVELDCQLVCMLNRTRCKNIKFAICSLVNDFKERIEYMGSRRDNERNVIKWLELLENVESMGLRCDEHTMGTLWKYISQSMDETGVTEFQLQTNLTLGSFSFRDVIFCLDSVSNTIQMVGTDATKSAQINWALNGPDDCNRDDFEFYE